MHSVYPMLSIDLVLLNSSNKVMAGIGAMRQISLFTLLDPSAHCRGRGRRELGTPQWTFSNTISISCFVQSPPNIYPTLEKHVLQLAPSSHRFEEETVILLSQAFKQNKTPAGKATHGLINISPDLLGILSCTDQPTVFTLQIVQFDHASQDPQQVKSYMAPNVNTVPDMEQCAKPVEMMELCQLWPTSQPQLIRLASQAYTMGSLYGYWDYWRVFEGICERHQISANQLVNSK
ncbi:unnamed protein product [Mucor fragilis]